MDAYGRERTLWVAALVAALIGSILVYLGVGAGRASGIGWLEYIREMFALVDADSVTPAGVAGFLLAGAGTLAAAFLLGHRWSVPVGDGTDRAQRPRAVARVWWGAAALAVLGLLTVLISLSAPQGSFSYDPAPYLESPSVIEEPMLFLDSLFVSSAVFVGAALLWTGLLVMSFLLGRHGMPGRASALSLPGFLRGAPVWWGGVALTVVGLTVVVISRVTTPPPVSYEDAFPATLPADVLISIEDPGVQGWAAAIFLGTALTIAGMLLMSIDVALVRAPARRRLPLG